MIGTNPPPTGVLQVYNKAFGSVSRSCTSARSSKTSPASTRVGSAADSRTVGGAFGVEDGGGTGGEIGLPEVHPHRVIPTSRHPLARRAWLRAEF